MKHINFLLFSFFVSILSIQASAQSPNLVGNSSVNFDNTNPCNLDFSWDYTNAGVQADAGSHRVGVYMTDDPFFIDPTFDILVAELNNGQSMSVGDVVTASFSNQNISQLPGFVSGTNYTVYYFLDSNEEVFESNESDNISTLGTTTCITVGIDEEEGFGIGLQVSPNPASTYSSLQFTLATPQTIQLIVRNVQGKVVQEFSPKQTHVGEQNLHLESQQWEAGIYLVQLRVGEKWMAKKLIVN